MTNDSTGLDRVQALVGDDYELQFIIGHGGMSTVWLATHVSTGREVAIKVLRPEFSDSQEFLTRFRNEAEAAENIDSANVVATYDYREADDPAGNVFCFIVMEYVRGESLADMLRRRGALDHDQALDVLEQTAHGLAVIHRMGLVHRDIKPGNILITESGLVKITDFGIAKAVEAVPLTRTGMVVGTAQYVSPEQAQGHSVSSSSDIYSLGVVGYELISGSRPFEGDSTVSVAIAHINQAPPMLPGTVPPEVRELIGICLRKDPQRRYADGNELSHAISAVRLGQRPPQPRSAALAARAPEHQPTSSTHALGAATMPTTVTPAVTPPRSGMLPAPAPGLHPQNGNRGGNRGAPKKSKPKGLWIFVVLALIVAMAAALYYLTTQATLPEPEETTTPTVTEEPTIDELPPVTETVIETITPTKTTRPTVSFTETPDDSENESAPVPEPTQPDTSDNDTTTGGGNAGSGTDSAEGGEQ